MSTSNTVFVNILDKEYQVACPPEEKRALNEAADELDARMRAIRASGNVIGAERIAVMAALNLCHELQQVKAESSGIAPDTAGLERLVDKLNQALESH